MIGRSLPPARRNVDTTVRAVRCGLCVDQHQIYAQPHIAPERPGPVIPPRVNLGWLFEEAKTVAQTQSQQRPETLSFRLAYQHLPFPKGGVVNIPILKGNVEIPE